jgi:hypothetical protein
VTIQLDIPMPPAIARLERDHRGYPVSYTTHRRADGTPVLGKVDWPRQVWCHELSLCSICGEDLPPSENWFVGGSGCAFHPLGNFTDPPMHGECAEYALRTCPFLAAPSYGRLNAGEPRPNIFLALMATRYRFREPNKYRPRRPYKLATWWSEGRQIEDPAEILRRVRGWENSCAVAQFLGVPEPLL